jgi:hypothetical protein
MVYQDTQYTIVGPGFTASVSSGFASSITFFYTVMDSAGPTRSAFAAATVTVEPAPSMFHAL